MAVVVSEAFASTKGLIESNLEIFERREFFLVDRTFEESSAGGPELTFRFLNQRTRLRVDVMFSVGGQQWKGVFVVQVINSRNETLDVEDFLRLHGHVAEALLFTYTKGVPDFTRYVEAFLSMLDRIFDKQLKPIISGENWESTPIDWQGYK